jgi:hypothetical protein
MLNLPLIGENSFINYQEFLASGTWYRPKNQKWTKAWILCVGGGGSGGIGVNTSYPGYGGGPGAMSQRMTFLKETSYSVTVGAGGASYSASTTATGKAGGATSFGALLNANGGSGGSHTAIGSGGPAETYNYKNGNVYFHDFFAHSMPGTNTTCTFRSWTYKRHSGYFTNGTGSSETGYGGVAGYNGNGGNAPGGSPDSGSGAGSAGYKASGTSVTVGAGGSGYCIVFWEEELNQPKCKGYSNLKMQEFSSSGTWYRPKRFPATFAYIFLVSTAATWCFSPHFLIEDSYSFVIGNPSTFGSIASTNYYCSYSLDGLNSYKHRTSYTSATLRAWPFETLAPTTSFIMWYE